MKNPVDTQAGYSKLMQAPVLYNSAFDDDTTQGLVTLSDAISCQVVFNWNQFPTLQMTYPRDGVGAQFLDYDLVIMTDISWKWTHQKFRIVQIQREGDDYLINANHVAADLIYKPTMNDISEPNVTATDVANYVINGLAGDDHEFQFNSDVDKVSNVNIPAGPAGNIFIDPDQEGDSPTNSIVGIYGGELEFDNRTIYHRQHAGRTTGIVIQYGKNLQTIQDDTNLDSTYTAIYPIAKYTPAEPKANDSNVNWGSLGTGYDDVGSVTYTAGGAVEVYDSPVEGHHVIGTIQNGQTLTLGSPLHNGTTIANPNGKGTLEVDTVNSDDWYPVQGGGWIDARWVSFDKSGDYVVNPVSGQVTVGGDEATPGAWSLRGAEHGYVTVNYASKKYGNGIRVFTDPEFGDQHTQVTTGQTTLPIGTKVSYDMTYTNSKGDTWYRIGPNRWVYGPHVTQSLSGIYQGNTQVNVHGEGYVKKGSQRYHWDSKHKRLVSDGKRTVITIKRGKKKGKPSKVRVTVPSGKHQITREIKQGDTVYLKTSGGWVKEDDVSYGKLGTHKPVSYDDAVQTHYINTGKVEMYADVDRKSDINWSIPLNAQVNVTAEGTAFDGVTMYQVSYKGKTGWIRSDLTNTNGDSDSAPLSDQDTSSEDNDDAYAVDTGAAADIQEVVVEVGTLYCDTTFAEENARIARVDLSSYFKHDDTDQSGEQSDGQFVATDADKEQLKQLAQSYMIEHNFGHPQTSLTVAYQQLTGLAGDATQLNLYDYVDVEYDKIGVHCPAEVTSTTWDCLAHRYTQVTIGDLPKSWQHLLMQSTTEQTNGAIAASTQRTQGWLNRFENMMASEGADRIAKENSMMDELGDIRHDVTYIDPKTGEKKTIKDVFLQSRQDFESHFQQLDDDASDIKSWIDAPGDGVIRAVPNWQSPQQLTANSSNGSKMVFGGNGLEFYDPHSGKLLTGFDSRGKLYADSIEGVTVKAMDIEALTMHGSLVCQDSTGSMQVYIGTNNPGSTLNPWQGGKVIWVTSDNYSSMVSSGQIATTGNGNYTRIHPTAITVGDDDNQVLTQKNFAAHAYRRIRAWVKGWVADYITVNGTRHTIWKDVDGDKSKLRDLPGQGENNYTYVPGSNDDYGNEDYDGYTDGPDLGDYATEYELNSDFQNIMQQINNSGGLGSTPGSGEINDPYALWEVSSKDGMLTYSQARSWGLPDGQGGIPSGCSAGEERTGIKGTQVANFMLLLYTPTGHWHWFKR